MVDGRLEATPFDDAGCVFFGCCRWSRKQRGQGLEAIDLVSYPVVVRDANSSHDVLFWDAIGKAYQYLVQLTFDFR